MNLCKLRYQGEDYVSVKSILKEAGLTKVKAIRLAPQGVVINVTDCDTHDPELTGGKVRAIKAADVSNVISTAISKWKKSTRVPVDGLQRVLNGMSSSESPTEEPAVEDEGEQEYFTLPSGLQLDRGVTPVTCHVPIDGESLIIDGIVYHPVTKNDGCRLYFKSATIRKLYRDIYNETEESAFNAALGAHNEVKGIDVLIHDGVYYTFGPDVLCQGYNLRQRLISETENIQQADTLEAKLFYLILWLSTELNGEAAANLPMFEGVEINNILESSDTKEVIEDAVVEGTELEPEECSDKPEEITTEIITEEPVVLEEQQLTEATTIEGDTEMDLREITQESVVKEVNKVFEPEVPTPDIIESALVEVKKLKSSLDDISYRLSSIEHVSDEVDEISHELLTVTSDLESYNPGPSVPVNAEELATLMRKFLENGGDVADLTSAYATVIITQP